MPYIKDKMMNWRWNSLWVVISFLTTVLCMVAILTIITLVYGYANNIINESIRLNNKNTIVNLSESVDRYIEEMIQAADKINTYLEDEGISNLEKNTFIFLRQDIETIMIFDEEAEIIFTTKEGEVREDIKDTRYSWFSGVSIKDSAYMVSSPHVQRIYREDYPWVITLTKGVTWEEAGVLKNGMIVIDMNFSGIRDLCKRAFGDKGYSYIVDAKGEVIYHPNQQMLYAGITHEHLVFLGDLSEGSHTVESEMGKLSLYVNRLENVDWKVIGVNEANGLLNYSLEMNKHITFLVIVLMGSIFVGGLWISYAIANPIYKLMCTMDLAWGEERVYFEPSKGIYEVTKLGQSFKRMTERINELVEQIKLEQSLLHKAELKRLTNQINPHFLYNTLESVVWLVQIEKKEQATEMIIALSKYFRLSLSGGRDFITVEEEMQQIDNYLMIEKIRFGEAFSYEIIYDQSIKNLTTPKIMLQPIVENAIVHGIGTTGEDGQIIIKARRVANDLEFMVSDNGRGISEGDLKKLLKHKPQSNSGIGLKNVHQRVQLLYGDAYGIRVESKLDEGTTVYVKISLDHEELNKGVENEKNHL